MNNYEVYLALLLCLTLLVVAAVGVFSALRMMNKADALKSAHASIEGKAAQAERDASRALQELVTLRTKNYEDLRDHVLNIETIARRAESQAQAIEESWKQLQAKEAARANREKKLAAEVAAVEALPEAPPVNGYEPSGLPRGFGKSIGRR